MKNFIILADSTCDLPKDIIEALDIKYIGLSCNISGKEYIEDLQKTLTYEEFYRILRDKNEIPKTSQVNAYRFKNTFEKYIKQDIGILYIAFSSSLSGTYNSSLIAKEEILEQYPNADISIVDTKSASIGGGLLVYNAAIMKQDGKNKDEIVKWLEENKLKCCHFFTVDSLDHLKRGGRISSTTATIGSLLSIKPILFVNNNGELQNYAKAKGRKKAIRSLFDKFESHCVAPENQTILIAHGDCLDDAKALANMIQEKYKVKDIVINFIGTTIGSHTGPGALVLVFFGETREP